MTLKECVRYSLEQYFTALEDDDAVEVYNLVLSQVEPPLLETILFYASGNQSKAAKWLGWSRNTLIKRLKKYGIKYSDSNRYY